MRARAVGGEHNGLVVDMVDGMEHWQIGDEVYHRQPFYKRWWPDEPDVEVFVVDSVAAREVSFVVSEAELVTAMVNVEPIIKQRMEEQEKADQRTYPAISQTMMIRYRQLTPIPGYRFTRSWLVDTGEHVLPFSDERPAITRE